MHYKHDGGAEALTGQRISACDDDGSPKGRIIRLPEKRPIRLPAKVVEAQERAQERARQRARARAEAKAREQATERAQVGHGTGPHASHGRGDAGAGSGPESGPETGAEGGSEGDRNAGPSKGSPDDPEGGRGSAPNSGPVRGAPAGSVGQRIGALKARQPTPRPARVGDTCRSEFVDSFVFRPARGWLPGFDGLAGPGTPIVVPDLDALRAMLRDAGLANDAEVAIRAGRVVLLDDVFVPPRRDETG